MVKAYEKKLPQNILRDSDSDALVRLKAVVEQMEIILKNNFKNKLL